MKKKLINYGQIPLSVKYACGYTKAYLFFIKRITCIRKILKTH